MGNRASLSFKKVMSMNYVDESVVLFSHWLGEDLAKKANDYIVELKTELENKPMLRMTPLGRLEPSTVMVDFIRWLTKDLSRVENDLYLGRDENDGDNSDNGHFTVILTDEQYE